MRPSWLPVGQSSSTHQLGTDSQHGQQGFEGERIAAWSTASSSGPREVYPTTLAPALSESSSLYNQADLRSGLAAFSFDQQSNVGGAQASITGDGPNEVKTVAQGTTIPSTSDFYVMSHEDINALFQGAVFSRDQQLGNDSTAFGPVTSMSFSAAQQQFTQPAHASLTSTADLASSLNAQVSSSFFAFPSDTTQAPSSNYNLSANNPTEAFSHSRHPPQSQPLAQGLSQPLGSTFSAGASLATSLPISAPSSSTTFPPSRPPPNLTPQLGHPVPPPPNANALQAHIFNMERVANLQRQITDMQAMIRGLQHQQQVEGPSSGQAHDRAASIAHLMRECEGYK